MRSNDKRKHEKLSRSRYLFLKNRENLRGYQCARFDDLMYSEDIYTVIVYSYRLRLQDMYESMNYEIVCNFLEDLMLDMSNSMIRELWNIEKSLTRNAVEILNYFVSNKINAIFECFSSTIGMASSRTE